VSDLGRIQAVAVRHWGRWVGAVVVIAIVGWIGYTVASSPYVHWDQVKFYLTDDTIRSGVVVTIELTILSMLIGMILGVILAVMRLSPNPVLSTVSWLYIWLFRGTPLLVQIIFWFNIALFIPEVGFGNHAVSTNTLVSPFVAALLALGLNEGAYMSEIVRAGVQAVDSGQREAALALGLRSAQTMQLVVLPQAMRIIVPPIGNQTIGMLKTTSLVSVIAAQDLLTQAQNIYAKNYLVIELLMVASIWYLALTTVASIGQFYIERYFGRSDARARQASLSASIVSKLVPNGLWRRLANRP
jgi:polar amino acid transport system permease protein